MKHTKRIFAILLSMAMILTMTIAMSATVFAAPADSPLTVTGLAKDDVAHFYKILKWAPNETDNVAGWKAVSPFDSVLDKAKLTEVLVGVKDDPATTDVDEKKDPTLITAELAGELARLAQGATPVDVTVGEDGEAELNLADGEEGMYMAIITPSDADTVYNPVFVSADFNGGNSSNSFAVVDKAASYSDQAAAKKSTVTLTKEAVTEEDDWDDNKWTTTAIGDTVKFTVKTTIPGYGKLYEHPMFKLTDKLSDLTLKTDSVQITKPTDIEDDDYTVTATASGYTIEFKEAYLKKCLTPTDIEVEYEAIVSTTAPVHVNTEKNEVSTEFSNNPSNESDHGFKKDTTQHYTFTIDANGLGSTSTQTGKKTSEIVKVGVDAKGDPITEERTTSEIEDRNYVEGPLVGAKFRLYTNSAATKEYTPKKADGTAGTAMDIRSDENGRLYVQGGSVEHGIYGLDAGTYYLKEVEAPAGYVADQVAHKIVITADTEEVEITEYTTDGVTWISADAYEELEDKTGYKSYTYKTNVLSSYSITIDDQPVASYTFTNKGTDAEIDWTETPPTEKPFPITNTKGTELPSTGGIGTIIFYVLGSLLVIGCGIVLISKRRLNGNK